MNWTEGNLSRHSKGRQRNELLTRQKQHFAKVRNGLLRGRTKQSPISISFLPTQRPRESGHRNDLSGLTNKPLSSPLLAEKRRRTRDSPADVERQSSIREKRRKLLDKADWVGLNLQQPINIAFPAQPHAATGSKWSRADHPRSRAVLKRREQVTASLLETTTHAYSPSLKIQIGNQEILPNASRVSQSSVRRYSLAPQPLASSSQRRSNPISSPAPSQARHFYLASENSQFSQISNNRRRNVGTRPGDVYCKEPKKPLILEEPIHVACSSSNIHAPIPRRTNISTVLEWSPSKSEDMGSLNVEIDRPAKPVPPSQEADQELWKRWVVSSSADLPIRVSTSPMIIAPSTSSRASVLPSHLQRRLPSYEISSEPGAAMSHSYPTLSTSDNDTPPVTTYEDVYQSPEQKGSHGQNDVPPADDDSAWRKFVFDDNGDELEERAFVEAAHQAAAELHPSETSTTIADATDTVATCGTDLSLNDLKEQGEDPSLMTSSENDIATRGTTISESAWSNLATVDSTSAAGAESRFRFAQPRTFIGKLVDSGVTAAQRPPLPAPGPRKRRGRPKKKALDGRTDIRLLPDFHGDPIEEFEDQ
ncbi:hypothetical protein GGS26DRAFT_136543 [Hypomontagnella submonticulosa]|nr:hypothetical protein GGS26DRAFT_136543 [Hypomontagnella submonticulosa]